MVTPSSEAGRVARLREVAAEEPTGSTMSMSGHHDGTVEPRLTGGGSQAGAGHVSHLADDHVLGQGPPHARSPRAAQASSPARRAARSRAGRRARSAATAHTTAAVSNVKRKAGKKPRAAARAPNSHAALCTPITTPRVRERKAKPPAVPCWRAGNAAMVCAMLGSWMTPRPRPTRAGEAAN